MDKTSIIGEIIGAKATTTLNFSTNLYINFYLDFKLTDNNVIQIQIKTIMCSFHYERYSRENWLTQFDESLHNFFSQFHCLYEVIAQSMRSFVF